MSREYSKLVFQVSCASKESEADRNFRSNFAKVPHVKSQWT